MTKTHSNTQKIVEEITKATIEGVVKFAQTIQKFGFGSIFIRISELGLYIKNANKQDIKFLNAFCELYDCVIPMKLIKSELFVKPIKDIPVNIFACTDVVGFLNDKKNVFKTLLESGLCRRFTFSFQEIPKLICTILSDEEERNIYKELNDLGKNLFDIFTQVQDNSCYKLTSEAKELLNKYKVKLYEMYNEYDGKSLLQKEVLSREYKALKLSCIYSSLNHPQELVINASDMEQAIDTVEFLSKDFYKFIQYKPKLDDKYHTAYNYLKHNYGTGFTKTHLVNTLSKECGFSREKLRKEFEKEFYTNVQEIAEDDGYCLRYDNAKHGAYYYLAKQIECKNNEESVPVKEIAECSPHNKIGYPNYSIDLKAEFCSDSNFTNITSDI